MKKQVKDIENLSIITHTDGRPGIFHKKRRVAVMIDGNQYYEHRYNEHTYLEVILTPNEMAMQALAVCHAEFLKSKLPKK